MERSDSRHSTIAASNFKPFEAKIYLSIFFTKIYCVQIEILDFNNNKI
jgi:hypothetical protein